MTVLRMKSLLLGVSIPREASRANQLESMNDPLNRATSQRGITKDAETPQEQTKKKKHNAHFAAEP